MNVLAIEIREVNIQTNTGKPEVRADLITKSGSD